MKDIIERLQDAVDLAHTPRELEKLCADSLAEIKRLTAALHDEIRLRQIVTDARDALLKIVKFVRDKHHVDGGSVDFIEEVERMYADYVMHKPSAIDAARKP